MNFSNAVGVSYNRRSEMAGDHLKIRNVLEINIRSAAIGNGQSFNQTHTEVAGKESDAFSSSVFYQDITINGVSFGSGYVSNLQAEPEGPDVQIKNYSATVTITKEGELDEILSSVNKQVSQYIDSISESYTEQTATHRKISTHSCSIKLNAPEDIGEQADSILKGILGDRNKLNSLFGFSDNGVYIFKNYNYDDESQSYNYENVKEWVENDLSDNSNIVVQQGSFQYSNGIITATFSVEITGITEGATVESRAQAALSKASSFLDNKADDLFSSYSGYVNGSKDPLKGAKINQSLIFNRNEAKCTVSVTYTNSFDLQDNELIYWEYGVETQKLADETIVSEQGKIIGGGAIRSINELSGSPDKYDNAEQFFGSNCSRGSAKTRAGGDGVCISESISRNYGEGSIDYKYSFSDNDSLLYPEGDGGETKERKKINSENTQDELYLHSTFLIPELKELLQKQANLLPNLKIKRSTISTNSSCILSDFKQNLYKPAATQIGDTISIRFSPKKRECVCESRYFEILN